MSDKSAGDIALLVIALLVGLVNGVLEVIAVALLWNWFAVPVGMMAMSWSTAFGILLLVGVVRYKHDPHVTSTRTCEQVLAAVCTKTCSLGFAIGLGWFAATFFAR